MRALDLVEYLKDIYSNLTSKYLISTASFENRGLQRIFRLIFNVIWKKFVKPVGIVVAKWLQ